MRRHLIGHRVSGLSGATLATLLAAALPLVVVGAWKLAVARTDGALPDLAMSVVVTDRDGALLRPFPVDGGRWRLETRIDDLDPLYLDMLRGYEDRRFDSHAGIDPVALLRAAATVIRHGRGVSGGSTLTMQVARLANGVSTAHPAGKLTQMVRAAAIEQHHDKAAILTHYLNRAPFGGNLEGVRTASLAYFGHEPRRLSAAEAALLVALPQAPEARRLDGGRGARAAALSARNRVLARARALTIIDQRQYARAVAEPLPSGRRAKPAHAAHVAERVVANRPARQRHRLTLDATLQAGLENLARQHAGRLGGGLSVAILVADHASGAIIASVGAADYFDRGRAGFIDMTRAVRSPGSTLKPLIYGLAFQDGLAHPETLIDDSPRSFGGYRPANFDGDHRGRVTMREALQLSLNVPAVAVLERIGPARLVAAMRRAGARPVLGERTAPNLAIGLGGVGVTLTDLVTLYASVARGGRAVTLRTDPEDTPSAETARILDPRAAWQVAAILAGTQDPNGITPAGIAFKTGTSYGHRDAWAIGFDGRHVVGVWVGRPDGRPLDRIGKTFAGIAVAAPILDDVFSRIGPSHPLPPPPPGTRLAAIGALPVSLQRFGARPGDDAAADGPAIVHPPDGALIESTRGTPLQVSVERGTLPLTVLVNGAPVAADPWRRVFDIPLDGAGQTDILVVDDEGAASRASVFVRPAG